jgi:hypothetical protein
MLPPAERRTILGRAVGGHYEDEVGAFAAALLHPFTVAGSGFSMGDNAGLWYFAQVHVV